jgi:hypothetical protein
MCPVEPPRPGEVGSPTPVGSEPVVTAADSSPLPRCCPRHGDWPTLADHLLGEFADVAADDVLREVARAKQAVETVALPVEERIEMAELTARHQLMVLSGRLPDIARLDPERHVRAVD